MPQCPTHRFGAAAAKATWRCSNCDGGTHNDGPGPCTLCGAAPPCWVTNDLLQSEHTVERQQLYGNDTRRLRKEAARERAALDAGTADAKPDGAPKGKGNGKGKSVAPTAEQLEIRRLTEELRKERATRTGEAAGKAEAAETIHIGSEIGSGDGEMQEEDPMAELEREIKDAERELNDKTKLLASLVRSQFGDEDPDDDTVEGDGVTGGLFRQVRELAGRLRRMREQRRDLLPLGARVRTGERKMAELERKLAANRAKLEEEATKKKDLAGQLAECNGRIEELNGFIAGQAATLEEVSEELDGFRERMGQEGDEDQEESDEEDAAPAAAAVPETAAAFDAAIRARGANDPAWVRSMVQTLLAESGMQAVPIQAAAVTPPGGDGEQASKRSRAVASASELEEKGVAGTAAAPEIPVGSGSMPRRPISAASFSAADAAAALEAGAADADRERTPRGKSKSKDSDGAAA